MLSSMSEVDVDVCEGSTAVYAAIQRCLSNDVLKLLSLKAMTALTLLRKDMSTKLETQLACKNIVGPFPIVFHR